MSEPRDFHIGTRVLSAGRNVATVVTAYQDGKHALSVVLNIPGGPYSRPQIQWATDVVHASDGAPLGEWVPVPEGVVEKIVRGAVEYGDMTEDINRWIRGELEL